MSDRHYVRFARAIALAGTLAGPAGCAVSTTPMDDSGTPGSDAGTDAGASIADAALADAALTDDAFVDCNLCQCSFTASDSGRPTCPGTTCCAIPGPLAPPNLPVVAQA